MTRQLIESIERRKDAMIAALWANSNFDDDKNTRQNAIEEIEGSYEEAVRKIRGLGGVEEEDIDKENPFFAAAERGMKKIEQPRNDEGTVKQALDPREIEIDQ